MKKILIVLSAAAIALTFGTVYAAEKDMGWGLDNGVTVFISNPAPTKVEGSELALENGITVFDTGISSARADEYDSSGSAAGGMAAEEHPYNGVTVFDPDIRGSN